jgi:hypothetical protein
MNITPEQLLEAFALYNETIWPLQWVATLLAVAAVVAPWRPSRRSAILVRAILAVLWAWIGLFFWWPSRQGFPPAVFLAAVFLVQGLLFLLQAIRAETVFRWRRDGLGVVGLALAAYALIYPLVGLPAGHTYPTMALSVAFPCPLIVLTFGLLLSHEGPVPKHLLIIPLIWGLSGVYWVALGMVEDVGLVLGALVATALIWRRDRRAAAAPAASAGQPSQAGQAS